MAFRDFPFPPSTILYPPHSVVLKYLQDYANAFNLEEHIHFSNTVTNAERVAGKWVVHTEVTNLNGSKNIFALTDVDSLLVSNGRCIHPFFPSIPGLQLWLSSSKAHHSISYHEPSPYANKSVVVVGDGPSGVDIAPEIATLARKVYHSTRSSPSPGRNPSKGSLKSGGPKGIEFCAALVSFGDIQEGKLILADGTTLEGIDLVVLATGYRIHCPFLQAPVMKIGYPTLNDDGIGGNSENILYNSGNHMFPLARHLFPIQPSLPLGTLFFFGLPRPIVPFPLTEAQALVISSVLSDPVTIDMEAEVENVKNRENHLLEIFNGDVKEVAVEWHKLPGDLQFDYREELLILVGLNSEVKKQVPTWQRRVYMKKRALKAAWKEIVNAGKEEEVCKDVGIRGEEEWVELMDRLIQRGESPTVEYIVKETEVHL
jgi:hypothetical protein